ncbi:MAG TPA: HEPN domain-containing protein [Spirochaetota bacterium]|nr:HEPN domain-containing protein [Spirochaetota bacterium]
MKNEEIFTLIKYRLEEAHNALNDAKFLMENNRSFQSIINRAYYAMFYSVLALLQFIGKIPSKHTGVISLFDTEFVLKDVFPKDLSKMLHKAFELRNTVDYKTCKPISKEKTEETLKNAEYFVKVIYEYLNGQMNKE